MRIICFSLLLLSFNCKSSKVDYNSTIEVLEHFSDLQSIIDAEEKSPLVINFWATSCPPCIKEMPHFSQLEREQDDLKVLLVSLDEVKDLNSRVYPFVAKYNITPEVVVLKDQNYSAWTDKIDTSWYGALPATLIIKAGNKRKFKFGSYESFEELAEDVNSPF